MTKSVAIVTLGCKTNQFESAAMVEQLRLAGYQQVSFDSGAELVIVNTCTVTAATDSQSRKLIRRAQRLNPQSKIVVTGCYAQIDPQTLSQMLGVSLVIGNQEKRQLLELLTDNNSVGQVVVSDIRKTKTIEPLPLTGYEQRSRAFIQIQNGCDAFCAYCIIPYARGRSRSIPAADIVKQVKEMSLNGYAEVVLTGIHIGNWGRDFEPKSEMRELVKQIAASNFSGRLRLGSIEPVELSKDLYRYVLDSDWICPHFHIPLQSGSDTVLQRMNRHYSTAFFADLLADISNTRCDVAIGLDVITGFPGETAAEFETTCQFLESLPFSHLHVFPFSKRTGTPAATMPDQVPGAIIKERAALLREIGERKYLQFIQRFIGETLELVIEGGEANGYRKGLSDNYISVLVPACLADPGDLLRVKVVGLSNGDLIGEVVSL